jgi:hypothetical protein
MNAELNQSNEDVSQNSFFTKWGSKILSINNQGTATRVFIVTPFQVDKPKLNEQSAVSENF